MNKLLLPLLCILALTCASCKNSGLNDDPFGAEIKALQSQNAIGTVEYTIQKIVLFDDKKITGDRKVVYTVVAHLKAGIPMDDFDSSDVKINKLSNTIDVTLPHAKLLYLNIPPEEIKEEYRKVGILRRKISPQDADSILNKGEQNIRAKIDEYGILKDAEINAEAMVKSLFQSASNKKVTVHFKDYE